MDIAQVSNRDFAPEEWRDTVVALLKPFLDVTEDMVC